MMRAHQTNGRAVKSETEQKQTQSHCCVMVLGLYQHEKILDQKLVGWVQKVHSELTGIQHVVNTFHYCQLVFLLQQDGIPMFVMWTGQTNGWARRTAEQWPWRSRDQTLYDARFCD